LCTIPEELECGDRCGGEGGGVRLWTREGVRN
jgi:hypothetical protein